MPTDRRRFSEVSIRVSTVSEKESSYVRTDESSIQMSSPPPPEELPPIATRMQEPKTSPSVHSFRQLQPGSLMEESNQAVKFADSDSSDGSRKSPGFVREADVREYHVESDDTSYAKAILNTQKQRAMMNGLSSSCEEDTDKYEVSTYSEAESDTTHPGRGDIRRRAKSLGALKDTAMRTSYGSVRATSPRQAGVSVIHNRRTDPGLLPLFPYLSQIMNSRKSTSPHGDDESTPLYSSYPSVKCDIVEYL